MARLKALQVSTSRSCSATSTGSRRRSAAISVIRGSTRCRSAAAGPAPLEHRPADGSELGDRARRRPSRRRAGGRPAGLLADYIINLPAFAGISMPLFWLPMLLIMLFSVTLRLLPASGMDPSACTLGAARSIWCCRC